MSAFYVAGLTSAVVSRSACVRWAADVMYTLDLLPNALLICVDETGSELLSDPTNPFFGPGG